MSPSRPLLQSSKRSGTLSELSQRLGARPTIEESPSADAAALHLLVIVTRQSRGAHLLVPDASAQEEQTAVFWPARTDGEATLQHFHHVAADEQQAC